MSQSNVGEPRIYEAGDQRNVKQSEANKTERFEEGKANSHQANDPKDERSIANRLAKESQRKDDEDSFETKIIKEDATKLAKLHGNEPSRGAKIDQELREEEEEILKKKGTFGPK